MVRPALRAPTSSVRGVIEPPSSPLRGVFVILRDCIGGARRVTSSAHYVSVGQSICGYDPNLDPLGAPPRPPIDPWLTPLRPHLAQGSADGLRPAQSGCPGSTGSRIRRCGDPGPLRGGLYVARGPLVHRRAGRQRPASRDGRSGWSPGRLGPRPRRALGRGEAHYAHPAGDHPEPRHHQPARALARRPRLQLIRPAGRISICHTDAPTWLALSVTLTGHAETLSASCRDQHGDRHTDNHQQVSTPPEALDREQLRDLHRDLDGLALPAPAGSWQVSATSILVPMTGALTPLR